jgi:3-deoxy-D-manno-octulosonic-acid transferase
MEPVDLVLAQSDAYADRFAALGIPRNVIHVVGNIKGHIRIQRPKKKEWLDIRRRLNIAEDVFLVTAGCMHSGEGKALKTFLSHMDKRGYPCRLIVVPRYCEEAGNLLDEIGGNTLHLTDTQTSRRWDVCVIEKVGILDDMYKAADAAIVGGTFADIGGHNVWDAACYAIPVFYGPNFQTQKESCQLLESAGVGFTVSDGSELAERMFLVVREQPMKFLKAQEAFIEATNRTRSIVEPLLP